MQATEVIGKTSYRPNELDLQCMQIDRAYTTKHIRERGYAGEISEEHEFHSDKSWSTIYRTNEGKFLCGSASQAGTQANIKVTNARLC